MTSTVAIRIRSVSHQFGEEGDARYVRALRDTSLDVARGELLCLIGPSGCGKTTLLNVIGGPMAPPPGPRGVGGHPRRRPEPRRHRLGVPQDARVPSDTPVAHRDPGL